MEKKEVFKLFFKKKPLKMFFSRVNIYVVVITVIVGRIDADKIPGTDLFTDTKYQISGATETGFNLLTYADVYNNAGEKFVQLDDHQQREAKYAPGGPWFQDGLWTFKLVKVNDPYVTIEHVLYPGYKLVFDADDESPNDSAPYNSYLILSKDQKYDFGGKYADLGYWEISEDEPGIYFFKNIRMQKYPIPGRFRDPFYKWVGAEKQREYAYKIKAV